MPDYVATDLGLFWQQAVPIEKGDPADQFLTGRMNLPRPKSGWPSEVVRMKSGSILFAGRHAGRVSAIEEILIPERLATPKIRSHGRPEISTIKFDGSLEGRVTLAANDPLTAMAVWLATGFETIAVFRSRSKGGNGNWTEKLKILPNDRIIVICRDDDPENSNEMNAVRKAQRRLMQLGRSVRIATPWHIQREDGFSFLDLARAFSIREVYWRVWPAQVQWDYHPITSKLNEARGLVYRAVLELGALHKPKDTKPEEVGGPGGGTPGRGKEITVSAGKTEEVLDGLAEVIPTWRAVDDQRVAVIAVPYHRLTNELLARATDKGISVKSWRGHAANDSDGEPMCRNYEAIKEASKLLIRTDTVCKTCLLRVGCRHLAQSEQTADLWIVAHHTLFNEAPKPIAKPGVGMLIVDETIHPAAICEPEMIEIERFLKAKLPSGVEGMVTLQALRARLAEVLNSVPQGECLHLKYFKRAGFGELGRRLTASDCATARGLEWQRKVTDGKPDKFEANIGLLLHVWIWRVVERMLQWSEGDRDSIPSYIPATAWIEGITTKEGSKAIKVRSRKEIASDWHVPTLLINGTLASELERQVFPALVCDTPVRIDTPHQLVLQTTDKTFSSFDLKKLNVRRAALAATAVTSLRTGRQMLIVSNKATVTGLKEMGLLPMIDVANYGAITGRNEWAGRNVVTLGRNQVPMKSVEDDVMALTGMPVKRVARATYPLMDKMFMMRRPDGSIFHRHTQIARHPNELVESMRFYRSTGELTQAGARDRALREEPDPSRLSVRLALSSEVLDQPINAELPSYELLDPPSWALQLSVGMVVFEVREHANRAYPALPLGRKKVFDRPAWPFTVQIGYNGEVARDIAAPSIFERLTKITYRIAGAGHSTATAYAWLEYIDNVKVWLEEKLGPLAIFEVESLECPHAVTPNVKSEEVLQFPNRDTLLASDDTSSPDDGVSAGSPASSRRQAGLLDVLIEKGIYLNPSHRGGLTLVASLVGKTVDAVDSYLRRHPNQCDYLVFALEGGEGSRWSAMAPNARYSTKVRLRDVAEGDEAGAAAVLEREGLKLVLGSRAKPGGGMARGNDAN